MFRLFSAVLLYSLFINCHAQSLTYGEAYDYQVGDVVATRTESYGYGGPPEYQKFTVLGRTNFGGDSIIYVFRNEKFIVKPQYFYWERFESTDTQTIHDLNEPVFTDFPSPDSMGFGFYRFDTAHNIIDSFRTYYSHDTVYFDGCNRQLNCRHKERRTPLSGDDFWYTYAYKGVGVFYDYLSFPGSNRNHLTYLLYTIKNHVFCGDSTDISKVEKASSVNAIVLQPIAVFPNPANKFIRIQQNGNFSFRIINMFGEKVLDGDQIESTINIEDLAKGLYLLQLRTEKGNYSARFIKE